MENNFLKMPHSSDYNDPKQLLIQIQSEKIHKNLSKSVKLFNYWARNIETYISNSQQLDKLKQELYIKQELINEKALKPVTRGSTEQQTKHSLTKELSEKIDKFNKSKKQSLVIKRFFEVWKEKNILAYLCLDHFKDITEDTINSIGNIVKTELVTPQKTKTRNNITLLYNTSGVTLDTLKNNTTCPNNTSGVTLDTFKKNITCLTSDIKSYQAAIKSDNDITMEIELKEKEIKEVTSRIINIQNVTIKQIENFQLDIESHSDDSTNFVAAEIGFLVEVQAKDYQPHIEYYHYPITFTNKNTFSIYDLQNETFNYFSVKNKKLCHSNYVVDDIIIKHTTRNGRRQANPSNDYHSESVLFFLCQQRSFQEKIINKLIKDLQKKCFKLTKLEKLILEIHSTNDMCVQCFQKAKYLINWKEENRKLVEAKQGNHFLEYFRKVLTKMLNNAKVLNQEILDLKIEIRFSYDKAYSKASTESHPCIIRFKNDNNSLLESDRMLSKYSIITSGGQANAHNNYSYAYNKAVEPARKHAIKKITKFLKTCCEREKNNEKLVLLFK